VQTLGFGTSETDQTSGNPTCEIAGMDADGSGYRRLTANRVRDGDACCPSWCP
jgi:hypothetical protein